jgi:hypothetical protein
VASPAEVDAHSMQQHLAVAATVAVHGGSLEGALLHWKGCSLAILSFERQSHAVPSAYPERALQDGGTLDNGTLEDDTARPELRAHRRKIAASSICEEFECPAEIEFEVDESGLPF